MAISGDVRCLIQADNGDILLGTNHDARIYKSSDNGVTWTQVISLGSTSSVTAFAKNSLGHIFATVILNAASQGVWRSTNHGATWTRVKTNPATQSGYMDIVYLPATNMLIAVGYGAGQTAGNVIASVDNGNSWVTCDTGVYQRQYTVHRIAGSEIGRLGWFGFESPLPMLVLSNPGTGYYPSGQPFPAGHLSTLRGYIPYAGKDIAVFGITNSAGQARERRIWAVQNGSNTEIYQYFTDTEPPTGNSSVYWGKISTITNEIFNALYVDPTPNASSQQRTIWAGSDGKIFVSYNSGAAWALATDAPVGQMHAFVRTTSGRLIAGGQNGEIFLFDGSGSEGGGDPPPVDPPIPDDPSVPVTTRVLGREATCLDEVFIANKFSFTNVTHVLHYNGSSYTNLQFNQVYPYSLLGETPAVGHAVYFGSRTDDSNVPGGPFSSLAFDIIQAAKGLTIAWEYWNGTAWTALTVQDNTDQFQILGAYSVHWNVPYVWATVPIAGITAYWVRARVTATSGTVVGPIHGNRHIYTVTLPYIEIEEHEIGGDIPAIARINWRNKADDLSTNLDLQVDRLIVGLRSLDRGPTFNAFLNISDVQTLFGVTLTKDADATWGGALRAPTARMLQITYASAGRLNTWNDLAKFTFSNTVARQYYGDFRAFVRCYKYGAGTNVWQLRLQTAFGSGGSKVNSRTTFPTNSGEWEVMDFGTISIPTTQIFQQSGNVGDQMSVSVQGNCSALGSGLVLYDLILIPTDEWAVDATTPEVSLSATAEVKSNYFLDIDSITNPKSSIVALNRNAAGQIVSRYRTINNGPVMLQRGVGQRLWFLAMSYENFWRSVPEIAGSVQVFKQQQYLGIRGRG